MKTILSRSIITGIIEMILVALVGLRFASVTTSPEFPILVRLGFANVSIYCMIPISLPIIILIITWVARRATRTLLKDVSIAEAKKQLMISVWVSSLLATLPILLPSLLVLVLANTSLGRLPDQAGLGIIFIAVLLILNLILVILAGLASRSMIKKQVPNEKVA